MSSSIDRASEHLARVVRALGELSGDARAAAQMLGLLGWSLPPGVEDIGLSRIDVSVVAAKLDALSELRSREDASELEIAACVSEVVVALAEALQQVEQMGASLQATPEYLSATHIVDQFFPRLADVLLIQLVGSVVPVAVPIGVLLGVFELRLLPADPAIFQVEHIRQTVHWDRFAALFKDPGSVLHDVYGWGTDHFAGNQLVTNLGRVLEHFCDDVRLRALPRAAEEQLAGHPLPDADTDPAPQIFVSLVKGLGFDAHDIGVTLYPLRASEPSATNGGVGLSPYVIGTSSTSFALSAALTLELSTSVDVQDGLALLLRAGRDPQLLAGLLNSPGGTSSTAAFAFTLRHVAPADKRLALFSAPSIQVDAASLGGGLRVAAGTDFNPALVASVEDGRIRLAPDGADGFLASVLPPDGITATMSLDLSWSHRDGLRIHGGAGLRTTIPLHQQLGPLQIDTINLGIEATAEALLATATVTGRATIGPVTASVDAMGSAVALRFRRGNLGPVDLGAGFKPPSGIGLSVDAQGVVTGGGFLFHDEAQHLYAGVMQLSLHDALTVQAFGLISTRMPDGSPGYSLLVFITAEDFQPIPLGLGFTLQGIGGMVGINRTFDEAVLRAAMQNDTLRLLLFPRDPVANAPAIISALASAFPARSGSYLLGIVVRIGWGTPTLIWLDLALILEFGTRLRLLALGRVSALLPSPDNDLVRLNLDAVGVLDLDQGSVAIDAVLVDSRLVHKFVLTGAGALRAGGSGAFVLAVGGFNPRFAPPAGVPSLPRVAIALSSGNNPRLICDAYFAITANTVQFGARAQLHAEAYGFSVDGDVGFDVLISRAPLHFIADFHALAQLKHGSDNLFVVSLEGSLEGPRPLRASGKASFEIFWCDFTVRFDKTLIDGDPPPLPAAVDVLGQLLQALSSAQSWRTDVVANRTHGVALRKVAPGTALVIDPLGRLVVTQDVVPLNAGRDIDIFGGAPVAGARRFALGVSLNGVTLTPPQPLPAAFAPAQFFDMSDDEKLASPSFEEMDAGLAVGSDAVTFDPKQLVAAPLEYESIVLDTLAPPGDPPPPLPVLYVLAVSQLRVHSATGAAARAPVRRVGRARFRITGPAAVQLSEPRWAIVPIETAPDVPADPTVRTWSAHLAALNALNRGGARYQLVPAQPTS